MKLNECPKCKSSTWGQMGSKEEAVKNISYIICTNHRNCKWRQKVEWLPEELKLKLAV